VAAARAGGFHGRMNPRVFCLVTAERAGELLAPLREHFADAPDVAVLVERRTAPSPSGGRSRAPVAERDPVRALPPELRPEARHLRLVQPLDPVRRTHESAGEAELIAAARAGASEAVSELWWRVSERVQTRLRLAIGVFAAERATSQMLGRLLDELPAYDPAREPLTAWLDRVVDRFCAERIPA
jgi:hypothetical protein